MPHHAPRLADLFLTRRELLRRCGMGFGERWGSSPRLRSAAPTPSGAVADGRLAPRAPHFRRQGQARHPPLPERRPVARRHVRPQAARWTKYHGKPLPDGQPAQTERKTGAAFAFAVQVPEARPERHRGQRDLFANTAEHVDDMCRHPLDARRRAEPRAVAAADELRRRRARPPQHRLLAHLRPGHARTRTCPASSPCAPAATRSRNRRTGRAASCPASTRAPTSTRKHTAVEKLIEHIQQHRQLARRTAPAARPARRRLNAQHQAERARTTRNSKPASQSFELAYRMQMEATDAFDISREPQHIRRLLRRRRRRPGSS